jgi:hypothetical protein
VAEQCLGGCGRRRRFECATPALAATLAGACLQLWRPALACVVARCWLPRGAGGDGCFFRRWRRLLVPAGAWPRGPWPAMASTGSPTPPSSFVCFVVVSPWRWVGGLVVVSSSVVVVRGMRRASPGGGGAEEVGCRLLPCARASGRHGAIGRKPSPVPVSMIAAFLGVDLPAGGITARCYVLDVWDSRVKTSFIWTCDGSALAS